MPYLCPITKEKPKFPVMTNNGFTYEFSAIVELIIQKRNPIELYCELPIRSLTLNQALVIPDMSHLKDAEKLHIALSYCQLQKFFPHIVLYQIDSISAINKRIELIRITNRLILAAEHGDLKIVRDILSGAEIPSSLKQSFANKTFIIAARNGQIEILRMLLSSTLLESPNVRDENDYTALCLAAQNGYFNIVELLLADPRIDPNKTTVFDATPLSLAVSKGHTRIVERLLIDKRVDPHQSDIFNERPLLIAIKNNHRDIILSLLSNKKIILYCLALSIKDPNLMKSLLENEAMFVGLRAHKELLWDVLKNPSRYNFQPLQHLNLLKMILKSSREVPELQHPLYVIFRSEQPLSSELFRPNTIIQQIQTIVNTSNEQESKLLYLS